MSVNKALILGHLGDEVKLHYFENGNCVGRFPVATNESYKNKDTGEKVTNTEWHNVVAYGKSAEILEKHLSKGDQIFLEGAIKTRSWESEGGKKYTTEIHVKSFSFIGGKKAESVDAVVVDGKEEEGDLPF